MERLVSLLIPPLQPEIAKQLLSYLPKFGNLLKKNALIVILKSSDVHRAKNNHLTKNGIHIISHGIHMKISKNGHLE